MVDLDKYKQLVMDIQDGEKPANYFEIDVRMSQLINEVERLEEENQKLMSLIEQANELIEKQQGIIDDDSKFLAEMQERMNND